MHWKCNTFQVNILEHEQGTKIVRDVVQFITETISKIEAGVLREGPQTN